MAADRATHATPFATNEAWRRCPALFRRNLWHLQVVDMAVVSGKRAVVAAETWDLRKLSLHSGSIDDKSAVD
jgi:hypothetical protein